MAAPSIDTAAGFDDDFLETPTGDGAGGSSGGGDGCVARTSSYSRRYRLTRQRRSGTLYAVTRTSSTGAAASRATTACWPLLGLSIGLCCVALALLALGAVLLGLHLGAGNSSSSGSRPPASAVAAPSAAPSPPLLPPYQLPAPSTADERRRQLGNRLRELANASADPCANFHEFACGRLRLQLGPQPPEPASASAVTDTSSSWILRARLRSAFEAVSAQLASAVRASPQLSRYTRLAMLARLATLRLVVDDVEDRYGRRDCGSWLDCPPVNASGSSSLASFIVRVPLSALRTTLLHPDYPDEIVLSFAGTRIGESLHAAALSPAGNQRSLYSTDSTQRVAEAFRCFSRRLRTPSLVSALVARRTGLVAALGALGRVSSASESSVSQVSAAAGLSSGLQVFFANWAQAICLSGDSSASAEVVNAAVTSLPGFSAAFHCRKAWWSKSADHCQFP